MGGSTPPIAVGSAAIMLYDAVASLSEYIAIMVEHKRLNAATALAVLSVIALATLWSLLPF